MSSAAWLAITIVIVTAAIKLVVDEKPHHRHLAAACSPRPPAGRHPLVPRVQIRRRACGFSAHSSTGSCRPRRRLAVRAAHAAAAAAAFAFDMAATAAVRANEWLNVRRRAARQLLGVRVVRTGFGAADVRVAGAGDVVLARMRSRRAAASRAR